MKPHFPLSRLLAPAAVVALGICCPLATAGEAPKKDYDPYIMYVFPAGGQRGTTVEIMARGRGLEGTSEVRISGQGVTGKILAIEEPDTKLQQRSKNRQDMSENPNVVKMSVTIAEDAELGIRDLRLVTPKGCTNRFRFVVGQLPEVNEVEPNEEGDEVQKIESLPVLVNGQVFQGDRDVYRFAAKAGQTLVFDVKGQALLPFIADAVPGWLQASLTLYDSAGKEMAYCDDFRFHPDPKLIYHVPADGEYMVEIKDVLFRGREDLVYRLAIGELPCITHIFPLGGKRGTDAEIELHGVNLPATSMKLKLTADDPPVRYVRIETNGLTSNSLPLAVDDLPEITESEPNDANDQANEIQTPVIVNGRIQQPGDVDCFLITAEAKQRLVVDVRARRLESPLDSIVSLVDARGREVAANDDTVDESYGLITHHSDSFVAYTFPAAGDYVLKVRDVQGQGGEEYAYRLRVSPPRTDYVLRIVPDNPVVRQGDNGVLKVKAFRRDGFNGPIALEVKDLPKGCVASPAELSPGQKEIRFTVAAAADAPLGLFTPKVTGTAQVGDESVVREASPSVDAMQAFIYFHNVPADEFAFAVVPPKSFTLSADVPEGKVFEVEQGGKVDVVVKAARPDDVKAAIRLAADTPPRTIAVRAASIAPDKDEATVTITVQRTAPVGLRENIILTGTARIGKDNVVRYAPAIPIKVIAPAK